MVFRMCRLSLFLSVLLLLGACGYALESSNQDITFVTPGTKDARCFADVDGIKYQFYPPETLNVRKSIQDMMVTCHAPGNREIKVDVPAQMSGRSVLGGPVGMAWDYVSNSLHYYPSVIAIDFSQESLKLNDPPKYNNKDIRQPESYDLEEIHPSKPLLNSDKYKVDPPLVRRGEGEYSSVYDGEDMDNTGYVSPDQNKKATIESVTDALLGGDLDPVGAQSQEVGDPAPLYSGE